MYKRLNDLIVKQLDYNTDRRAKDIAKIAIYAKDTDSENYGIIFGCSSAIILYPTSKMFPFSVPALKEMGMQEYNADSILSRYEARTRLKRTYIERTHGKDAYIELKSEQGNTCYINKKAVELFADTYYQFELDFYTNVPDDANVCKSAVYITVGGDKHLCGMILPFKF